MSERRFGARFIDEMRRLTRSTGGLEYRDVQRITLMEREEFMAAFAGTMARLSRDPVELEPEQLARTIVERGQESDWLTDLVNVLGGLA